jgi:hypothetical protein
MKYFDILVDHREDQANDPIPGIIGDIANMRYGKIILTSSLRYCFDNVPFIAGRTSVTPNP